MSQNRRFQDGDTGSQRNSNGVEDDSSMVSALKRLEQELMVIPEPEIQHAIEPLLETLVRSVIQKIEDGNGRNNERSEDESTMVSDLRKVVEVMVIHRVHHVVEPIMERLMHRAAKVIIESVVEKILTRNSGNEMRSLEPRILQLRFQNKLSQPVWTGMPIKGENCPSVKIALVDGLTGDVVNSGPEALAKVEIVVLQGDFDDDEGQDWTAEEFNRNIVREREGNKSLLNGNAYLNLKEGIGYVGEIYFIHTATWMSNRIFRLGARMNGARVREAKTEPFIIKDRRMKLYEKLDSPSLSDAVWRLRNIDRRGAFYKRLSEGNIETVQQFLTEFFLNHRRLQDILGTCMSDKILKETVDHALTCKLDDWYLYYSGSSQQKFGVVFNVVGQVLGVLSEYCYVPICKLSETEKDDAHKLVVSAFEHWGEVVSVDKNSLNCDSSDLANALYFSNSPILENPRGHNNGTYHMIDGYDSSQPHNSPQGIILSKNSSPSGYNNGISYMINEYDSTQPCNPSLGDVPSYSLDPSGHNNGIYHMIDGYDSTRPCTTSPGIISPNNFNGSMSSTDDFGFSDVDLKCASWSPPDQFFKSMIPDFDEERPQFGSDYCNIQAVESHADQRSAKSGIALVGDQAVKAQRIWGRTSIVLRFQQRIRIVKSNYQKRQRCS